MYAGNDVRRSAGIHLSGKIKDLWTPICVCSAGVIRASNERGAQLIMVIPFHYILQKNHSYRQLLSTYKNLNYKYPASLAIYESIKLI